MRNNRKNTSREGIDMKGPELMDRIRDEMAASKDGYIDQLGELMTAYLQRHPEAEIEDGRTLNGAYGHLKEAAGKKQRGGCYAMPRTEAVALMLEYFGQRKPEQGDCMLCCMAMMGEPAQEPERPAPRAADGDLDLDALLGGL